MCPKGGSKGYNDPTAAWQAQRAIDVENERKVLAQQQADEQRIVTQQQADAAKQRAAANRTTAMDAARTRALSALRERGANPDDFVDVVNERLNYNASLLPDNTEDFTAQFGDPFVESVVSAARDRGRNAATRWWDSTVGADPEERIFTNNLDDPYVDRILGQQRTEAMNTLNRAKARGQLDDTGFASAVTRIGELENAGRSTAQNLSNAVIANKRSDFRSLLDRGKAAAGSLDFGQSFDANDWSKRLQSRATELTGGIEGDVSAALSGQQFFDIGDIITKGGQAQGVANPTPAFLDAQAAREQLRTRQRGTGQGGTF